MTIYSQLTPNFLRFELRFNIKKELLNVILVKFHSKTLKNMVQVTGIEPARDYQ